MSSSATLNSRKEIIASETITVFLPKLIFAFKPESI